MSPRGPECVDCGYSLGHPPMARCPECGLAVTEQFVRVSRTRQALLRRAARDRSRYVLVGIVAVVLSGIGVGVILGKWPPAVGAVLGTSLAMLGVVGLIHWLPVFVPSHERPVSVALGYRFALFLHIPWLMIIPGTMLHALVMALAFGVLRLLGKAPVDAIRAATPPILIAGFCFWAIASLVSFSLWTQHMSRVSRKLMLSNSTRRRPAPSLSMALILVTLFVWICSAMLGLMGGALGGVGLAEIVAEWFGNNRPLLP